MNEWITWEGGLCPVHRDGKIIAQFRDGSKSSPVLASSLNWMFLQDTHDVVAYQLVGNSPRKTTTVVKKSSGSKYLRDIQLMDGKVDVYAVLEAFNVECPARQHAIKKLLCAGLRGKGSTLQDLNETVDAVNRAIDLERNRKGELLENYR